MPRISHSHWLATLTLPAAFLACAASAAPLHRVQYEVYNDQQTAPRDGQPASDLQILANQQTPSELQSHGNPQQSDQPSDRQPSSSEQKSEQASEPQSPPEQQQNAFVSGKSNEPQDVAQTEAQSSEQSKAQDEPEQKSSESPAQQAAPPTEPKSGEDDEANNP